MDKKKFHFFMIKPTHFDDEGYPIQWNRSVIPSNTLAVINGLAIDAQKQQILGPDISIELHPIDESNQYVDVEKIAKIIQNEEGRGLIGFIGVQTNQYPRTMDLARRFAKYDLQMVIGGFHVSGMISMFDEMSPELIEAQNMGLSLFIGEAEEGRLHKVILDAFNNNLQPSYNYMNDLPNLQGEPVPFLDKKFVDRTIMSFSSFDLGRGCPFDCSFCSIINVQGKKSRYRSEDDLEKIIRQNHAIGNHRFFLTDDNFARNKNWENILDRIIKLKDEDGINVRLTIQVDTQSHKISRFVEKCYLAGVEQIFLGLENINPDNLKAVKKGQNKINDYKKLILSWKRYPIIIIAGYIIGMPCDTKESILNDVETIKKELAIDALYFTYLTPLPGSEDHQTLSKHKIWMDEDLNKYDLYHRVTHHPKMSDEEWEEAYKEAWESFYSWDHMTKVLKRMGGFKSNKKLSTVLLLINYREYFFTHNLHTFEAGDFRIKRRKERRSELPIENFFTFHIKNIYTTIKAYIKTYYAFYKLKRIMLTIWNNPKRTNYRDQSMILQEE